MVWRLSLLRVNKRTKIDFNHVKQLEAGVKSIQFKKSVHTNCGEYKYPCESCFGNL